MAQRMVRGLLGHHGQHSRRLRAAVMVQGDVEIEIQVAPCGIRKGEGHQFLRAFLRDHDKSPRTMERVLLGEIAHDGFPVKVVGRILDQERAAHGIISHHRLHVRRVHLDRGHGERNARIEQGEGVITIDGVDHAVKDDDAVIVPQGARHNVRATGDAPLKLYTIYGPPEHIDGTVHRTCAEAQAAHEHFDGRTTE